MSEDQDRDSRTEEATEKRVTDTIEKGNVPFSREVPNLISLLVIIAASAFAVPAAAQRLVFVLQSSFVEAGVRHLEQRNDVLSLFKPLGTELAAAHAAHSCHPHGGRHCGLPRAEPLSVQSNPA